MNDLRGSQIKSSNSATLFRLCYVPDETVDGPHSVRPPRRLVGRGGGRLDLDQPAQLRPKAAGHVRGRHLLQCSGKMPRRRLDRLHGGRLGSGRDPFGTGSHGPPVTGK